MTRKKILFPITAVLLFLALLSGCTVPLLPGSSSRDFSGAPEELTIGGAYKYYYARLDDTSKHAYNAILSDIWEFPERVQVPVLTDAKLNNVFLALLYDNPELFFLGNRSTVRQTKRGAFFYPEYVMGQDDYYVMQSRCSEMAKKIADTAATYDTEFQRERSVHDQVIAMCEYNDSGDALYRNSIYGPLCAGSAGCEGYAKTAKYVLDRLHIPCYVVTGQSAVPGSQSQAHMWDVVQIGGQYYHLDLTWDDPVLEKGGSMIEHDYFNVTDAQISRTHSGYASDNACTAIEANYFVHEHLLFSEWSEAERDRIVGVAAEQIVAGSEGFQIRFAGEKAYQEGLVKLIEGQQIYDLLTRVQDASQTDFATDKVSYVQNDDVYGLDIILVINGR